MKTGKKELLSDSARRALIENVPVIEAALSRILVAADVSSHECDSCKLVVKNCFRDAQLTETVKGTRQKLQRWLEEAKEMLA